MRQSLAFKYRYISSQATIGKSIRCIQHLRKIEILMPFTENTETRLINYECKLVVLFRKVIYGVFDCMFSNDHGTVRSLVLT